MFPDSSGQWRLRQPVSLERGERYRATAVVRGDEPRNLHLEVFAGGRSFQVRAEDKKSWQTLTMDFQVPKKAGRRLDFRLGFKDLSRKGFLD